jgi:DNA-binding NarL/FixJ family response regulator
VWIGQQLMQQLIQRANSAMPVNKPVPTHWTEQLTSREREIASLAAHGATNAVIAAQCDITERTVKAHLSAVFEKLSVTDRLQLALKVHGIQ